MNTVPHSPKKCKICSKKLYGRKDKIFCSVRCKNYYHVNLRRVTNIAAKEIDLILHRNRSILLEIMGKNLSQKKIPRVILEKKKFRFNYLTHLYTNSKGKTYHWVYDFGWMSFSTDEILIVRKRY
tara:strand:- start:286755 stop:287129 length:375 start_codon:yes stop_codon:yes gene_type:complete